MNVPILNPIKQNSQYIEELKEVACKVLESGQYILGEKVLEFEENIANYLNVKHAIGVSSGTDALLIALMALGIGPGDEVICPDFTFFATAGSVSRVGATPVFASVDPESFNISSCSIKELITNKTKAIIPVHLFGQSASMQEILDIAHEHRLFIVEDSAQAIGTTYQGAKVGGIGDIGCFSFFPSKNLGGFGDAGLVATNHDYLAEKLRTLRVHGGTGYFHSMIGGNFRIDAMQAALLNVKLKYLDEMISKRRANAEFYFAEMESCFTPSEWQRPLISMPKVCEPGHTFNQFTVKCASNKVRSEVLEVLDKKGVGYGIYYPCYLSEQRCYVNSTRKKEFSHLTEIVFSLPVSSEITLEQKELVVDSLMSAYEIMEDKLI